MSLQPADKKHLAALTAVVVVAVAIIAVATTLLVRGQPEADPQVSVASGRSLEQVEPTFWCDLEMTECRPRALSVEEIATLPVTQFPVPTGGSLTLSVPSEIAAAPWMLVAAYGTPEGVQPVTWIHQSGTTYTQVLDSTPERVLLGVEIKPFSTVVEDAPDGIESGQGDILFRGHYAVSTAPDGFTVANETELPAVRG